MKKEKTINLAARMMAEQRWKGVTPAERKEHQRRAAQTPRTAKRCFCGASSMQRAADRYFDCCRRAGVITLNLKAKPDEVTEPGV
ncbi:MAG TPA: hypothetical protein VNW90_19250 [Acetobacteraceae bacterium]|jgi:hypothetical protein|nr:hypothetical protein [Acetobacteraceae bacterium]